MKTLICYDSHHHGNTKKVAEAMAGEGNVDLVDVSALSTVSVEEYDCIGLASGIYGFSVHQDLVALARQLPQGKPLFFVYTYGLTPGTGAKALYQIAKEKGCPVLGEFSCRGYDTFGPFQLVGGISKGHPDEQDLEQARGFFRGLLERLEWMER